MLALSLLHQIVILATAILTLSGSAAIVIRRRRRRGGRTDREPPARERDSMTRERDSLVGREGFLGHEAIVTQARAEEWLANERARVLTTRRVLVVEDDDNARRIILRVLSALDDIDADGAASLTEARLRLFVGDRPPDLVLLDLALRDGYGWQLFDALPSGTSVVLMSGNIEEHVLRDVGTRIKAYTLLKPFSIEALERVVLEALGRESPAE